MRALLGFKKENKEEKERNTLRESVNTTDYEKEREKTHVLPLENMESEPLGGTWGAHLHACLPRSPAQT